MRLFGQFHAKFAEFFHGEVRRMILPRTPVNSVRFALLRFDLYTWHTGDGSRLPLSLFG